ncbi:Manganese transporter smf1 [Malassezia vespertilionis]|uniref:Smf1p n=1 Tax=Malassezia vespertilionis TaxID=2020962 RepID=A0A2N1J915_9BASI|nr:Manganese transporter smf1 [Malassezia vespertilionis]PKI83057.1 hypothetical protein MVES_002989 [Malassezia vespertilionis]WFD07778.1 Manganese transporter smf1 [Malassezia vespertilionis]
MAPLGATSLAQHDNQDTPQPLGISTTACDDEQMLLLGRKNDDAPWWKVALTTGLRHLSFVGPGIIASVAYFDPGNWATDMEAGSRFGYKLLFTVLLSGLFAILLQVLCARLGTVTGYDLATQTRRLVLGLPVGSDPPPDFCTPKMRFRFWALLVPLYIINEAAIVATELAELIGSAIALNMLFPKLPLWGGVLVTTADVFLILLLYRPSMSVRIFETLIGVLVIIVLTCFIVLLVRVDPNWGDVFHGYIPSPVVVSSKGLYVSISILGATIMPHSLVLGSHFATIDRLEGYEQEDSGDDASVEAPLSKKHVTGWRGFWYEFRSRLVATQTQVPHSIQVDQLPPRKPASLRSIQLHVQHASWDIAICLVLFAITINSAILIVASAGFYYGNNANGDKEVVADLFQAFNLLRDNVGKGPAILFAIALLAAGQSSSITVTLAGQLISEGFIHWKMSPFMRRLLTRAIAVVPSMVVATVTGRTGLDKMLVASQVALSMALPFVSFPLIVLTCSRKRMVREVVDDVPRSPDMQQPSETQNYGTTNLTSDAAPAPAPAPTPPSRWRQCYAAAHRFYAFLGYGSQGDCEAAGSVYYHRFQNGIVAMLLSWAVFFLICIADIYVLYFSLAHPDEA